MVIFQVVWIANRSKGFGNPRVNSIRLFLVWYIQNSYLFVSFSDCLSLSVIRLSSPFFRFMHLQARITQFPNLFAKITWLAQISYFQRFSQIPVCQLQSVWVIFDSSIVSASILPFHYLVILSLTEITLCISTFLVIQCNIIIRSARSGADCQDS